jgi:hypothetical protein
MSIGIWKLEMRRAADNGPNTVCTCHENVASLDWSTRYEVAKEKRETFIL